MNHPKFIQFQVVGLGDGDRMYGLSEDGQIWWSFNKDFPFWCSIDGMVFPRKPFDDPKIEALAQGIKNPDTPTSS